MFVNAFDWMVDRRPVMRWLLIKDAVETHLKIVYGLSNPVYELLSYKEVPETSLESMI